MKKTIQRGIALFSVGAMLMGMTACGGMQNSVDLTQGVKAQAVGQRIEPTEEEAHRMTDFAVRLLQQSESAHENSLVSPLSVEAALAMTLNGASGETRTQMEEMLGMKTDALNEALCGYLSNLPQEKECRLSFANGIWFRDEGFEPNEAFLQKNADTYKAELCAAPMNADTCRDINHWVKEKTEGMIPEIVKEFNPDTVMCLVNALVFDAKWQTDYESDQLFERMFVLEDASEKRTDFMKSTEHTYLEDEKAEGFIKNYKGGRYGFAALLPKEGVTLQEYLNELTGEHLYEMLKAEQDVKVNVLIPEFKADYAKTLNETLQNLGMKDAFDVGKADFSNMGQAEAGNIFVSEVLHKTYIEVNEQGTRAAAATAVVNECGAIEPEESKQVFLTRPFLYMIVDREAGIPIFIGTMYDPEV